MIKNDFLEKMIEQISDAITTITGLKGKTAFKDAHESIKEALKQFFGLNPKSIETLQSKSLIDIVTGGDKNNIYLGNYTYRKLHPIEAERLQTLPDNYTSSIKSGTKRIGLCGNGWTVDVITYILKNIK